MERVLRQEYYSECTSLCNHEK